MSLFSRVALSAVVVSWAASAFAVVPDLYETDYETDYERGYDFGYSNGYDFGFVEGTTRGTTEGESNGQEEGFQTGWDESYQPAYDIAYEALYPIGSIDGYASGLESGVARGYRRASELYFSWIQSAGIMGDGLSGVLFEWSLPLGPFDPYGGGASGSASITISGATLPEEIDWSIYYFGKGNLDGYSKGKPVGDQEGFDNAYPIAFAAAFESAYDDGRVEGELKGTSDGGGAGYDDGWDVGEPTGKSTGYWLGYSLYFAGGRLDDFDPSPYVTGFAPLAAPLIVPEPSSVLLVSFALLVAIPRRTRR